MAQSYGQGTESKTSIQPITVHKIIAQPITMLGHGTVTTQHKLHHNYFLAHSYENDSIETLWAVCTFSDAVASRVPCRFIAMQDMAASCAATSNGGRSVLARSTICTWPVLRPGKVNSELLLLGQSTQRPDGDKMHSCWCDFTKIMSLASRWCYPITFSYYNLL